MMVGIRHGDEIDVAELVSSALAMAAGEEEAFDLRLGTEPFGNRCDERVVVHGGQDAPLPLGLQVLGALIASSRRQPPTADKTSRNRHCPALMRDLFSRLGKAKVAVCLKEDAMNAWKKTWLPVGGLAAGLMVYAAGFGAPALAQGTQTAIFAGGCFWCVESDFDHVKGVVETISGFTGGTLDNPTYQQVSHGGTGHYEAVKITYDSSKVSYDQLLTVFWHSVDPTDAGGQFCDRGDSYRTAIFATNDEQLREAEASKTAVAKDLSAPIATKIVKAGAFYPAEDYHQNYYQKNPLRYRYYRWNCGRDQRIDQVWGDKAHLGIEKPAS
ncbi:peptide-methionine (S)-S-oxide reductase MsrA [Consotaella aegiceratis]|uniref:peptide-methionine (S)-S-oxide reductase MsrA n=1 Tax=Consotaella aegiceratis TaxID=3097961 RepID=UPI002F405507